MKIVLSILLLVACVASAKDPTGKGGKSRSTSPVQKPPTNSDTNTQPKLAPWLLISHNASWKWTTTVASQTIVIPCRDVSYPTFLVNTTLGPMTGKTLSATVTMEDITGIYYPGLGAWNNGGLPASIRFYLSTSTSYSMSDAAQDNFWWSSEFDVADFNMTLSSSTVTSRWSNGMGKGSDDPAHSLGFQNALKNAKVVGIALCGGSFFDMGWIYYTADGPENLSITSLTVQ